MILGKAAVYISLSMLSNNAAFICLPLASVCNMYLFVSGDSLLIGNQPCCRRRREKGLAPVACTLLFGSQPAVLQLFSLRDCRYLNWGAVSGAHPCTGQEVTGGEATPLLSRFPAALPAAPSKGTCVGAVFECQVLLWDTKIWQRK